MQDVMSVEDMLRGADYSAETNLKNRLARQMGFKQVRQTSYMELSEKLGMNKPAAVIQGHTRARSNEMQRTEDKIKTYGPKM